jgi:hypothetical protein
MPLQMASVRSQSGATRCLADARWRRPVFAVGQEEYDWTDIFLDAMRRGRWARFERRLVRGVALATAAETSSQWPTVGRVSALATAFRHDRNLLSGTETIAWLAEAGISIEAWNDHLIRQALADAPDAQEPSPESSCRDEDTARAPNPRVEITVEAFNADGFCTGEFDQMSVEAAARAAVHAGSPSSAPATCRPSDFASVLSSHATWLSALDAGEVRRRLARLESVAEAVETRTRDVVTATALAERVAAHGLEWMRVDMECLSFATIDEAREAICLIRADGLTPGEVAMQSHCAVHDQRCLLGDLDCEWHAAVLAASAGDLIGPVALDSCFHVAAIVAKAPPDLADALVRARAERAIVDRMFQSAVHAHVRWLSRRSGVSSRR